MTEDGTDEELVVDEGDVDETEDVGVTDCCWAAVAMATVVIGNI